MSQLMKEVRKNHEDSWLEDASSVLISSNMYGTNLSYQTRREKIRMSL